MPSPAHAMPFGAAPLANGGVRFRLWAPGCEVVDLDLDGTRHRLHAVDDGWHEFVADDAGAGLRYRYFVPTRDGALAVPDPASRCKPDGMHGPSMVVEPQSFTWSDVEWCGRPWREAVVYELHAGAFTLEGTFRAATARPSELARLGITAIELMPLARFAAFADEAMRAGIPDPNAEVNFVVSTLKRDERSSALYRDQLDRVCERLALRHRHLVPRLGEELQGGRYRVEGDLLRIEWPLRDAGCWHLLANFSAHDLYVTALPAGECSHAAGTHDANPAGTRFAPGGVMVILGAAHA